MAELKGTFYGVSVGPGDPELMTLQAVRLIRQCPVLAAPQTASGQMLALDIARSALGEALDGKTIVPLYFAMSRDPAALAASHEKAAAAVRQYLDAGQDVAMLNIGDVSIYATFGYLQEILQAGGYATAMAAGVPSFCAAAARLNVPLTGGMDTPFTIAPHCQSKAQDPAVVVLDECGRFAVPILSGHLGGANDLARALAAVCGAVPVITTATDANGVFAVDEWAKHQNCTVLEPERIKLVSGALLAGKTVQFASDWPIAGAPPDGITAGDAPDFALTLCPAGDALHLVPRIGVLGVGCKRGTGTETLAEAFAAFCAQNRLAPQCITAAASIDLKQNEAGLLTFCKSHSWPAQFFTAEQLCAAPGSFTPSAFVQSVTGVDNVCERSAVLAAGGTLVFHKYAHTGVTFALAVRPYAPDWRWQNV